MRLGEVEVAAVAAVEDVVASPLQLVQLVLLTQQMQ